LESDLKHWARAITLVSESEADLYRRACGDGPVRAVSNGVDLEYFVPQPEAAVEPAAVFVGALDYRPNVDGICWFCEEIWPSIRRARPRAKLYLVGRQPVPAVRKLGEIEGVVVVGQVPDVRPHIAKAAFAVVPLRIARGIQNKVLEAMAMAKPVIASPEPLIGLRAVRGQDVLAAATPEEWLQHAVSLLDDAGARQRIGSAARDYVERYHCWEKRLEPFAELIQPASTPSLPATAML
jgi:sugar transferase (PEP-CTERM/EpsH1 system associated)